MGTIATTPVFLKGHEKCKNGLISCFYMCRYVVPSLIPPLLTDCIGIDCMTLNSMLISLVGL